MRTDQTIKNKYTVTAGVTSYSAQFPLYEDTDVAVYLSTDEGANERRLTLGTDYTVQRAADNKSGTVVLAAGVAEAGNILALISNLPYTQELDLNNVSTIDTESMELQLDRDCQQRQQIVEKLNRALTLPSTSNKTPEEFSDEFYQTLLDSQAAAIESRGAAEEAKGSADRAQTLVDTAEDDIVAAGDAQVARVIAEGDTQESRVTSQGDTQNARIIAQGDTQNARIIAQGDTQEYRLID
ncbi:MAG: hypothetical protein J6M06_00465, partial [Synergistaceae bacterium]|nr:hypothetical protein [Synergistaceae bacterium]